MLKRNYFYLLSIIIILFTLSCKNKKQEIIHEETIYENTHIDYFESTIINEDIKEHIVEKPIIKAIINKNCDYYEMFSEESLGRLLKGQEVTLGYFYYAYYYENEEFDIRIEIKTIDETVHGYVSYKNITFIDRTVHYFWFNNKLLTMEYYYTGTTEEIFHNDHKTFKEETDKIEKVRKLQLIRAFFTQIRWYITENYMVTGDGKSLNTYRIESIIKNENEYLFLLNHFSSEFEIVVKDEGDGITIIKYNGPNDKFYDFQSMVNIKYVPFDINKTESVRSNLIEWITELIELLGGDGIVRQRYPR